MIQARLDNIVKADSDIFRYPNRSWSVHYKSEAPRNRQAGKSLSERLARENFTDQVTV